VPEFGGRGVGPPSYVTLCGAAPPKVHVTVPPVWITTAVGLNEKSATETLAVVCGAAAASVNVAALGKPVTLAFTFWSVDEPIESLVVATPFALVVL
jgi:hypothetical protein